MATDTSYVPRLRRRYDEEILGRLMGSGAYRTPMEAPRLVKITLNMGVGEAKTNARALDAAIDELTLIAGQRAQMRRAKKSIAGFKIREGMPLGAKVTLRGARMYEFLDRLFNLTLPRVRDFQGINPNSFDGRGNFAMGMKEQLTFPEIEYDKVDRARGMDIIIVTTAQTDAEARSLLQKLGLPFRQAGQTGPGGATRMM